MDIVSELLSKTSQHIVFWGLNENLMSTAQLL